MYVANPFSDPVFKFMLNEPEVAKAFISAIIGKEILEPEDAPNEYCIVSRSTDRYNSKCYTVASRCFFAKPVDSSETVLVELHKAKFVSDIVHSWRDFDLKYLNPEDQSNEDGTETWRRYCIFLLGDHIGIPESPVLYLERKEKEKREEENKINTENLDDTAKKFISNLHHRSWIVQTAYLDRDNCRNDLEKLLGVFDQKNKVKSRYWMNGFHVYINDEELPAEYTPIIRRLRKAGEWDEVLRAIEADSDFVENLRRLIRQNAKLAEVIEKKNKAIEEKNKVIEGKRQSPLNEIAKHMEAMSKKIEELEKLAQKKD